MRRVVLVAYYYPPSGGAAALRALGFARHLPAHGWAATVVAPAEGTFGRDPSLPLRLPPPGRVIRCLSPEPVSLIKRGLGRTGPAWAGAGIVEEAPLGRRASRLRALVRDWAYVPDAQGPWIPFATLAAMRASRGADVILSSGPPISAHVAAWLAARLARRPWVADVRDLWNPYRDRPASVRARLETRWLLGLLRRADAVVTISDAFRGLLASVVGRPLSVFDVVRHGFDAEDYADGARRPPDRFTLTFTGLTHGERQDLTTFLDVLAALLEARRIDRTRFRLRVLGKCDARTRGLVTVRGLDDILVDEGFRTHAEAVAAQRDATALLLLVWSRSDELNPGVRPAKLPEYLGAGRPILALGDPAGEAGRTVREHGAGETVAFDDAAGIRSALLDLYGRWRREGDLPRAVEPGDVASLSRAAAAGRLARVLDVVRRRV